ncbi:hypothetical protein V2H45_01265 [Tumidithrix elongata RA019]|uniref:Uncharacterized protein n=1 Tax=Tumidithrix elongata BACA0141 TaxID=2716417 RepID=A0AAW9PUN7_9CYAN|nr:hypothetical protein [Tumidithrix elongata RA019]
MSKAYPTQTLTLELASDLYDDLQVKAKVLGKTPTEFIEQGLRLLLEPSLFEELFLERSLQEESLAQQSTERVALEHALQNRFSTLEKQLENYVNILVEQRLKHEGFSQIKFDLASNTAAIATIQTQLQTQLQTFNYKPTSKPRSQAIPQTTTNTLLAAALEPEQGESETSLKDPPESQEQVLESQSNYLAPTIRQLQVGDLVQIRDPDSPYYMEKLRLTKVSLIRASVQSETGEHTYLKRDLRFVQSESEDIPEN